MARIRPSAHFEVERILSVSSVGTSRIYQVQWSPTWICGEQLVGCEQMIEQFIQRQLVEEQNQPLQQQQEQHKRQQENHRHKQQEFVQEQPLLQHQFSLNLQQQQYEEEEQQDIPCQGDDSTTQLSEEESTKHQQLMGEEVDSSGLIYSKPPHTNDEHSGQWDTVVVLDPNMREEHDLIESNAFNPDIVKMEEIEDENELIKVSMADVPEQIWTPERTYDNNYNSSYNMTMISSKTMTDGLTTSSSHNTPNDISNVYDEKEEAASSNSHGPVMCSVCHKTYASKANLRRHFRLHTGEKPYTCTECEKSFSDQSAFSRHIRSCGCKRNKIVEGLTL